MTNREKNGFSNQPLCDSHLHIEKGTSADRAIEIFDIICNYYNYERVCICALTGLGDGFCDPGGNIKALYIKAKMNGAQKNKCYVFGHIYHHLDGKDTADGYLRQVKKLYEMGVDGYKFIEGKPDYRKDTGFAIDDPIYDKMYAFIEEKGLPITHHIADPRKCWDVKNASPIAIARGWVYDESFQTFDGLRAETEGLLKKFPKLKVTFAHFFFISDELEEARRFMDTYPNISFDMTPGGEMFVGFSKDHDGWVKFFNDYSDRIYYGTDTYNYDYGNNPDNYEDSGDAGHRNNLVRFALERTEPFEDIHYGTIIPLSLSEDVRKKIYHDNFVNRQGDAREVNKELCALEAANILDAYEHGLLTPHTHSEFDEELGSVKAAYEYFAK